jgi:hypothetical protein
MTRESARTMSGVCDSAVGRRTYSWTTLPNQHDPGHQKLWVLKNAEVLQKID